MPDQPAYPGVYIEEIPSGVRPITGVATSVTAFLGAAARGPVSKATRISSFADFERIFGGLSTDSEMSYGVRQFFLNGGHDALIIRIVKSATPAHLPLVNAKAATVLTVTALDAGTSGNEIEVGVDYLTPTPDNSLNISFTRRSDGCVERYPDVSMNSADARYLPNLVNSVSQLVAITRDTPQSMLKALPAGSSRSGTLADVQALLDATHADFQVAVNGLPPVTVSLSVPADIAGRTSIQRLTTLARAIKLKVQGQAAGNTALSRFSCTRSGNTLLLKSEIRGEFSSVRVLPGRQNNAASVLKLGSANGGVEIDAVASIRPLPQPDPAVPGSSILAGGTEIPFGPADIYPAFVGDRANHLGLYALDKTDLFNLLVMPGVTDPGVLAAASAYCEERRAFLIVDAPPSASDVNAMVNAMLGSGLPKSDHAAVYFPWTVIADPLSPGQPRRTPPSGSVAGVYARTDSNRGVWKAPAGTDAHLAGVQSLALPLSDADNGRLNPLGVNCLRSFPTNGTVVWGSRTLRGADSMGSEYKYVPVRRLALHIEESLYRGTQWAIFEPNNETLWAQIRLAIDGFMNSLFRQGAFQGTSARDAYLVKCDRDTTTQNDIDKGVVNILVGFAPLKPAEFVLIRIQQRAGQVQA
ncbi:MAG: phage tail sheath family protein [Azonexaceae bacterium]|nr:phage tail sheath family protein [Azonexaceae bacterium]